MTQETLELANVLLSEINKTAYHLEIAKKVLTVDALSSNGFALEIRSIFDHEQQYIFIQDESIYREVYRLLINVLTSKLERLIIEFEAL